jgi:hypothetical protein
MQQAISARRALVKRGGSGMHLRGEARPPVDRLDARSHLVGSSQRGITASAVPRIQGELTIFTAASLTEAFKGMAAAVLVVSRILATHRLAG